MPDVLAAMALESLSGQEQLVASAEPPVRLVDYWRWSGSELMSNTERGVLAEFLVAIALGVQDQPREEWGNFDLEATLNGRRTRLEVKSSAERQSWKGKPRSYHSFHIGKTGDSWGELSGKRRWADVYVFCILKNLHATSQLQALDSRNWEFLVLPTATIERERPEQKTIRAGPLREVGAVSCSYGELAGVIAEAARTPMT